MNFLEIWEREAAPAELNLSLTTIPSLHAFESERVLLCQPAAAVARRRTQTIDAPLGRAPIEGGWLPDDRPSGHPCAFGYL
jgi:hypothetical protein